ncbi:MAG: transposase [Roseiflexaceae bacterium]|nr:transposase [Roseiflexaceae bacterium]
MRKAFKYRIYLTRGQKRILEQQLEECRWLYNEILAIRKRAYEETGVSLRLYDTQHMIPILKEGRPSLKQVHSLVLQNVNMRVDLAFQAFFRRARAGAAPDAVGFPRFKGFGRYDSITYAQYGNGVRLDDNRLILSKVGVVRLVLHRPIEGTPKTVTLTRARTKKWYASFSCEAEPQHLEPSSQVVGIDMGLTTFATLSDSREIKNPRFFRRDEADLKRVQRAKDAAKNSQNWDQNRRRKKALAHIHERIANRRNNFAHQLSRQLVDTYQVIVFEELEPQKMGVTKGRGMRKSLADAAWNQLIGMTVSKAEEAGRAVVLVDPRNTTKACSHCSQLVPKALHERVHACPHCGLVLGRDQNAAINILARGLEQLRQ